MKIYFSFAVIAPELAAVVAVLVQLVAGYWAHFAVLVVAVQGEQVPDCCLLVFAVAVVVEQVAVEVVDFAVGLLAVLGLLRVVCQVEGFVEQQDSEHAAAAAADIVAAVGRDAVGTAVEGELGVVGVVAVDTVAVVEVVAVDTGADADRRQIAVRFAVGSLDPGGVDTPDLDANSPAVGNLAVDEPGIEAPGWGVPVADGIVGFAEQHWDVLGRDHSRNKKRYFL